jgi:hypothetical protein
MNKTKRYLGFIWLLMAGIIAYYGFIKLGYPKLVSGKQEDLVFGIIIVFILLPIVVGGLAIFGKYASQGEYNS